MNTTINTYINFAGKTREAMEFYKTVFGGELSMNTFGDFHMDDMPANGIMHADLHVEGQPFLMGSDAMEGTPEGFALALGGDGDTLRGYFDKLSDGCHSKRDIQKEQWGDEYGEVVDKYNIRWMFNIAAEANPSVPPESEI